ncbi:MAG: hypothetical protein AAFV53_17625 [Myxococcota bacterium]
MRPFFMAAALCAPTTALAQSLDINIDSSVADQYDVDVDDTISELSDEVDAQLNIVDQQAFLQKMANAAAWSSRGMGVDYASNVETFIVGMSVGSAVNASGATFSRQGQEIPEGGFSAQISVMAGVNLGFGNMKSPASRFRLFVHGLTLRPQGDFFDARLYNVGGHVQFEIVRPRENQAVAWGGLAVTTGYELAGYSLNLNDDLPIDFTLSGQDMTWQATGDYTIQSATQSVPVELSSNARILFVTLFGGLAADVNLGATTSEGSLVGDLFLKPDGEDDVRLGDASLSVSDEGVADWLTPRAFAGAQADLLFLKVYGQLNLGINETFGGNIGVRFAM